MPICKRSIEPVDISRKEVVAGIDDELECVSNNTMANIVLQLSSLSKLAEDLFSELHLETCQIFYRTCKVAEKVESLRHQIIVLNPTAEEVSLHDINQRKHFKSMIEKDQEIITITTRPTAIKEVYEHIDQPPTLYLLDPYREDGKQSMKFYTDPGYFFELWKQEVAKDAKNQIKKQKAKVKRRPTKDMDPVHGIQSKQDAAAFHDQNSKVNLKEIPFPDQGNPNLPLPYDSSVLDWKNDREGFPPPYQTPVRDANDVHMRSSAYDQFPQPPQMSNSKFGQVLNSLEYDYRHFASSGIHQSDNLNFDHSQTGFPHGGELDPKDDSLQHLLNSSFPSPPNFHNPSNDTMNNSSYFPPPPSNLTEGDEGEDPELEEEGYQFSAGVQDLLNMIEGTPPRNMDAINGNPMSTDGMDVKGPGVRSPTFPADIPSPLKSPPKQGSAGPPQPSKLQTRGASFLDREMSPDHLNTSGQRIIRDKRSDLLEAIRKGIQLRKVEERRMISERRTTARFDVQAIMEAAFELRRKAVEGNDSEEGDEDGDADGGWSDEG